MVSAVTITHAMPGRKYRLVTFGCQMNKSDSERIATLLEGVGYAPTDREDEADLILMNTCSVRQTAEDRVYGSMRKYGDLKRSRPGLIVAVTGCMAGRDRDGKIRARLPDVDLFFPTRDLPQLPRWLAELDPELLDPESPSMASTGSPQAALGNGSRSYLDYKPKHAREHSSFVTIQTGCNKFCTYCVVPWARGLEENRSAKDILEEIRERAEQGTVEVTLLGQTVNAYRAPDPETFSRGNPYKDHFAALLWEVNGIPGIRRVHFTAPHPLHMTDEVIDALTLPNHVNYLHLPIQAGDDEVLRKMNRRYTAAQYLELVEKIREKKPEIAIGTDIIVGFCGETAEAFEKTVELYEKARFDVSYTAQYSPRSGTTAHRFFQDDVPREEKKRRWNVLQELMEEIVLEKNQAYVGKKVEVLVDRCEPVKRMNAKGEAEEVVLCTGNSREMKAARFEGTPELAGKIVNVRVTKASEWVLDGAILSS
jgi:tRNA-2-methylthio-N6-dimethylallyladenosine synthase